MKCPEVSVYAVLSTCCIVCPACLLAGQSVLAESEMGGQLGGRAGAGVLGARSGQGLCWLNRVKKYSHSSSLENNS